MKSYAILLCIGLFLSAGCSGFHSEFGNPVGNVGEQKKTAVPEKEIYPCVFTPDPIKVDGLLDEPAWKKAKVLGFILPGTFKEPNSKTEGRLLYDNKYLYVGIKAYDQDVWATYTQRDSNTWEEDVLEVFLKPDPAIHLSAIHLYEPDPYYEFEFSPLGTIFDAFYGKRGAAGNIRRWSDWNCEGLKVATKIKGTLNNWHDKDEYWTLEVAIPFAGLPTLVNKSPQKGDTWLFHLARYDYSVYLPEGRELTSCAPLSRADFHLYEDWLKLIFK